MRLLISLTTRDYTFISRRIGALHTLAYPEVLMGGVYHQYRLHGSHDAPFAFD